MNPMRYKVIVLRKKSRDRHPKETERGLALFHADAIDIALHTPLRPDEQITVWKGEGSDNQPFSNRRPILVICGDEWK